MAPVVEPQHLTILPTAGSEQAPLLLAAPALTPAQRRVAQLVLHRPSA
jgi:hypothetical protein